MGIEDCSNKGLSVIVLEGSGKGISRSAVKRLKQERGWSEQKFNVETEASHSKKVMLELGWALQEYQDGNEAGSAGCQIRTLRVRPKGRQVSHDGVST